MIAAGCVVAAGGSAILLILRQRAAIQTLCAQLGLQQMEIESLQAQLAARPATRSSPRTTPEFVLPAADPNAFAGVSESAIPGRYKWTQSEQEKGILTLFPDHTFENHKGEKFSAYRWQLSRERLVMEWNLGTIHYTNVVSPGVYIGVRTDGQTARLEKVE